MNHGPVSPVPAEVIDISFDFRTDARGGDPDKTSPTLRRYHQALWSKELPCGGRFTLDTTTKWEYLHHKSEHGEFFLSSDSVIATFLGWHSMTHILEAQEPDDVEEFERIGYTIGGMMVFPSNRIDNGWTINMARGMKRSIADRMDLTLECISRYYAGDVETPLGTTLERYASFFDLFGSFEGYAEFFLLQDLLDPRTGRVRFFTPFDDFDASAAPRTVEEYATFRENSILFVEARNRRIADWAAKNLRPSANAPQE